MEIILLERIAKLGQMGDVVNVKTGYARNFLLPQGKALRATQANIAYFETKKTELEARNLERKTEAEKVAEKMNGVTCVIVMSAGETGQLYGSVAARDIVEALDTAGYKVEKSQVQLNNPIKIIGLHNLEVMLHPEVVVEVVMNVARSEDEAKRQAKGEDLTLTDEQREEIAAEQLEVDKEAVFENPEDVKLEGEEEDEDEEAKSEEAEGKDDGEEKVEAEADEEAEAAAEAEAEDKPKDDKKKKKTAKKDETKKEDKEEAKEEKKEKMTAKKTTKSDKVTKKTKTKKEDEVEDKKESSEDSAENEDKPKSKKTKDKKK